MVAAMCIRSKNDTGARSIIGLGALMPVACLAGPALTGALGAIGIGAGAALLALCGAVPAVVLIARRRPAPGRATVDVADGADR
jgi:hypothetical protein